MMRVAADRSVDQVVLRGDPLGGFRLVQAAREQSLDLGLGSHVTSHTSSQSWARPPSRSLIASTATAGAGRPLPPQTKPSRSAPDRRPDDRLQLRERLRIGEDEAAERLARSSDPSPAVAPGRISP